MARLAPSKTVRVDAAALHDEHQNHPRRVYRAGKDLADAKLELAQAKADLDLVKAETYLAVRADPSRFGVTAARVSEGVVDALVLTQPRVRKAVRRHILAAHAVDSIKAEFDALIQKGSNIDSLTYLHNQGYYAGMPTKGVRRRAEKGDRK